MLTCVTQRPAFSQAGSTGGTIGKENKSVSGADGPRVAAPARSGSKAQNPVAGATGKGCGKIVGAWKWSNGLNVVVKPDGTADATDGGHAILTCDGGMYLFKWQAAGNNSRMTLASDGKQMSGRGFFGSESAVRK
jgi:hypothetical protein